MHRIWLYCVRASNMWLYASKFSKRLRKIVDCDRALEPVKNIFGNIISRLSFGRLSRIQKITAEIWNEK